jgi:hypothetical protein
MGASIVYVVYGTLAAAGALTIMLGLLTASDRYKAARNKDH